MKRFENRKRSVIRSILVATVALFVWLLIVILFAEVSGDSATRLNGVYQI